MNELYFLAHCAFILSFLLLALRLGREALIAFVALSWVLANFFVFKQMRLCGLNVTCSDVFSVAGILGMNLLQEYFGKSAAKVTLKITFFLMAFFVITSFMHLLYVPSSLDWAHEHYARLLSPAPRVMCASLLTCWLVARWDVEFFAFLNRRVQGRYLLVRSIISVVCAQLLDTVLFSIFGLYGMVHSIVPIIFVSYAVKMGIVGLSSPFIALSRYVVSKQQAGLQ